MWPNNFYQEETEDRTPLFLFSFEGFRAKSLLRGLAFRIQRFNVTMDRRALRKIPPATRSPANMPRATLAGSGTAAMLLKNASLTPPLPDPALKLKKRICAMSLPARVPLRIV